MMQSYSYLLDLSCYVIITVKYLDSYLYKERVIHMNNNEKVVNTRIVVVGIVVSNREEDAKKVNDILSAYGHLIVGRMGIPYKDRGISVISIIVDGTNDDIGALTGKLGNIRGVKVKSVVTY
ncbi:MAG: hypothetical protein PWP27_2633 [Clostridiales bacterium]|nr:hypothetical protein [Clostridiales bacterium]MDK2934823.1 hypothetical protein [Clostridiales bacterium]